MSVGLTAVIDYGLCNIDSMVRALEECGACDVHATRDPRVVARADRIVLPGVGSFEAGMRNLTDWGLRDAILEAAERGGVPFLGACLGMQLMASSGFESKDGSVVTGLGLVGGEVVKLQPANADERVPHIGWNEVVAIEGSVLFDGLPFSDFYFVHSYYLKLVDPADEAGRTPYCGGVTVAIELKNKPIFGVQFHPEKSQKNGFRLLKNFLAV